MRITRLQTRFVLAGALLVLTTVVSGLWSAWTFARLSTVVGDTLRDSQATIDLTTALAGALEREDDALLLALSGKAAAAREQRDAERQRGDELYRRLGAVLGDGEERDLAGQLRRELDAYRRAGSDLIAAVREGAAPAEPPAALQHYHEQVNPLLRQAVATCARIREVNFRQMQQAGTRARDEAGKATGVVAGVCLAAVLLASLVAAWLARSVLRPVRELTASVEALRRGDFDRRVPATSGDELGQLAAGFNRMAESLAEYRRSSLGELLVAKSTLEATLNALPDAVFVLDPDGRLVAVNPPGQAVLQARHAAGATRLQELPLLPGHREAVDRALAGQPGNGSRTDFSQALTVKLAGSPHRLLVKAVPIPEFLPRRTGAVVVLDDVTEFAQLDELRSELIGVASHELKTPLTSLRMNLLLLGERADNLTPRQHEILAAAVAGCEELGSTIDELLDVTRIEAGQLRLELAPLDVYAVLDKVLRSLQSRCEDAHIAVQTQRDCDRAVVRADAGRLGTVFTNLLTNALKYSPAGGTITVRVWCGPAAGGGGPPAVQPACRPSVLVAVTDSGPGIPAEFRERVFEKFFRVEDHQGQAHGGVRGTGIGLYLCREIIKAHGGSIRCEAGEGGRGTRLVVTLPFGEW
jgi:NtrC-family two-component system sensor histidine kinase KinB